MKAWVFGGMVVLSAALAACSSSETGGTGTGGSGGSSGSGEGGSTGSGDGGASSSTTASTAASPTTTSNTTATTASGQPGNGICDTGLSLDQGGPQDTCLDENCCTEFTACFGADGSNLDACNACLEANGGPLCDGFIACFSENCGGGEGVCGTDLATQDPALNECIDTNCCTEFAECFGADGSNLDACNACLEAQGGPLCDGYIACLTENCDGGGGGGVCGTDLGTQDPALNECIDTNCCTEFGECFGEDGSNLDACNACLEAEGGPLCDGYIACLEENCAG